MKQMKFILLITIMYTFTACSSAKLRETNPLFKSKWVLSELNGTPVQMSNTDKDAHLNFLFNGMGVSGSGGCNRLTGTFISKGDDLSFGPLASTKMMCADSQFETAFFSVIEKVNQYAIVDNVLELKQDKKIVAKLIPR